MCNVALAPPRLIWHCDTVFNDCIRRLAGLHVLFCCCIVTGLKVDIRVCVCVCVCVRACVCVAPRRACATLYWRRHGAFAMDWAL
jgi:hypothetical protein